MIVETIYIAIKKITLRRKEVCQLYPELGFRKTVQWTDPVPDPWDPIHAMIVGPSTNREGRSRVTGMGQERHDGPAKGGNRYDVSTRHPKPLPPKILSLSLFTFLLPHIDECTSSRIGSCQGEKSENLRYVVRISKRESKGEVRKQEV